MALRLLVPVCLFAAGLLAQRRGAISGEIVDPTGAGVPAARIQVRAPAIGITRDTVTNENGYFTVPVLPYGDYEITVEASGFKTLTRTGVRLDADIAVHLKLQLEVGQITERVEVTSEAPLVETSHGDISRMVTQQQLQNFALPGRNPFYMLGIMPGVVSRYGNFMTDFRGGSYSMGGLQINGQRKDTNFIAVDGVNNGRVRDGVQQNNILGVDFIEEVKIHTTHYAPEFGRNTGAQINFVTRRGTQDSTSQLTSFTSAIPWRLARTWSVARLSLESAITITATPSADRSSSRGASTRIRASFSFLSDWKDATIPARIKSSPQCPQPPSVTAISAPAR